jgi:hypothetical protein
MSCKELTSYRKFTLFEMLIILFRFVYEIYIYIYSAFLLVIGCAKSENKELQQENQPIQTELTVGGDGGSSSKCFDTPCPCNGDECKGFFCCKVRTAGTEDIREACRRIGNQPLPHYVYVGIDGFNQTEVNHSHYVLQRTHNNATTILVFNAPNAIDPGQTELLWLDDGLPFSWVNDEVTYDLFLYDSSSNLISSHTITATVD